MWIDQIKEEARELIEKVCLERGLNLEKVQEGIDQYVEEINEYVECNKTEVFYNGVFAEVFDFEANDGASYVEIGGLHDKHDCHNPDALDNTEWLDWEEGVSND